RLLDEDLDFIVHLGDYVYETTGDPSFQSANGERLVSFRDESGAIQIGEGENSYFSASSLDNYRQLYQTVRSDEVLQQIHERFPMIAIWDDHEFSDDSHGATSTITSGREPELNTQRKQNAEQAYFEFMPIDTLSQGTSPLFVLPGQLYPNTKIYRDFTFGRNLHLVMTDFRTYRPDHLIPEDGFPGTVVMSRFELTTALAAIGVPYEAVAENFTAYLNIDSETFSAYKPALTGTLTQAYMGEGLSEESAGAKANEAISGNLAADAINGLLAQYNAAVPAEMQLPLITEQVIDTLDRGVAYMTMGKTQLFSSLGSRYFVVKDVYDLYAGYRYALFGSTQDAYGAAQENWYQQTLLSSQARWKVVGSSVSHTSLILDLTNPALGVPAPFNQKFYLNLDHWDGFGGKRDELIQQTLSNVPGSVLLAGDIHASFVSDHGQGTYEFTNTSVSSGVFRDLLAATAANDPLLSSIPGITQLIQSADILLQSANPSIAYANTNVNGVAVVTASSDSMTVNMYEADKESTFQSAYTAAADYVSAMQTRTFMIDNDGNLTQS
ncbi:MAG: alkaline phosphatase D family protein, partial [Kangiellaceae bacterium]|nr:alkaline phosphatase D family protein [Kangiellaceae bacterium]